MLTMTICVALSAAGLVLAFVSAYRRRFLRATRIAALALIPLGLAMAGLTELVGKIGEAIGDWAAGLVLNPTVWAGFAVLGVSAALLVVARVVARRGAGRKEGAETGEAGETGRSAVAAGTSAPALGPGRRETGPKHRGKDRPSDGLEDFKDIEAILKKHGI
jgi:hypothetical protein